MRITRLSLLVLAVNLALYLVALALVIRSDLAAGVFLLGVAGVLVASSLILRRTMVYYRQDIRRAEEDVMREEARLAEEVIAEEQADV